MKLPDKNNQLFSPEALALLLDFDITADYWPCLTGKFAPEDVRPVILRNDDLETLAIVPSDLSFAEVKAAICSINQQLKKPVPECMLIEYLPFLAAVIDSFDETGKDVTARGRALRAVVSDLLDAAYPAELRNDIETNATLALAFSEFENNEITAQVIADIYLQDDRGTANNTLLELVSIGMAEYVDFVVDQEETCLQMSHIESIEGMLMPRFKEAVQILNEIADYR